MEQGTGIDLHFAPMEQNKGSPASSRRRRRSSAPQLVGSIPYYISKKKDHTFWCGLFFLEQGTGIEPAFTAWEAVVLPIYEPCIFSYYSKSLRKNQGKFVGRNVEHRGRLCCPIPIPKQKKTPEWVGGSRYRWTRFSAEKPRRPLVLCAAGGR